MSLNNESKAGGNKPLRPLGPDQPRRIPLKPVTSTTGRSFGRVLQPIGAEKRPIYSKPNPHERLWNPSPNKKAKAKERHCPEIISTSYDYDKENETNEVSERHFVEAIGKKNVESNKVRSQNSLENLRNRYAPVPATTTSSTDLNNSFTEKISNLGLSSDTPSPRNSTRIEKNERSEPEYPYITEILNYWHKLEVNYSIDPYYMYKQREISHKMRTILIDWLAEVAEECKICNATFHRCVQFIDRFLSKLQISRSNLQLLGTTCLFIACKVEEIHPPETGDLVYLTDNTYTKSQLLRMECLVLSALDFDLMIPTPYEFGQYFASCLNLSPTANDFTFYVIELTLLYGDKFLNFNASVTAAAACYVAFRCCEPTLGETSIPAVLGRIKRLHLNGEFRKNVEQAIAVMFGVLIHVASDKEPGNSVCNRYRQFQDQKYFLAAVSCAACFSLPPWRPNGGPVIC